MQIFRKNQRNQIFERFSAEGDQVMRTTVGFGAGASKLSIQAEVFQHTEAGTLRPIVTGRASGQGSKKPGLILGPAAGAGTAVLAVSGAVTVGGELAGQLKRDVDRLSELLSDRAVTFYEERGWR